MKARDKTQVMVYMMPELKAWLSAESASSGRSQSWLVCHALELWKSRLDKQRGINFVEAGSPSLKGATSED